METEEGGSAHSRGDAGSDLGTGGQSGRGGIVTARGTGEGLVVRLDGRVGLDTLRSALSDFMQARQSFLTGNEVVLEWVGELPEEEVVDEVTLLLGAQYKITVKESRLWKRSGGSDSPGPFDASLFTADSSGDYPSDEGDSPRSLFDGMEAISSEQDEGNLALAEDSAGAGLDPSMWDDADTRLVCTTLRSGQRIETEHSLIVCGDVNFGAELVAGGDIIVLGTLRGVAHAGAYDETGGGRFIFALDLRPTQLRIGSVISRGSEDRRKIAEIARVDGNKIVVVPYSARDVAGNR